MKKQLIDVLNEKYVKDYNIEEVLQFKRINITVYPSEDGTDIFQLRQAMEGQTHTTWHIDADTLLYTLLNT